MDALFGGTSSAGKRTFLAKQRTEYLWARLISSRCGELFKVAEGGEVTLEYLGMLASINLRAVIFTISFI